MPTQPNYLHNHPDFPALLRIVAEEMAINPILVEKDYWIMHCLYGLQQLGLNFELKGGTSLSKGFGIIGRFSEDIDIRIEPPGDMRVMVGLNHDKPAHNESRKQFYDWLASNVTIEGIISIERDTSFDDTKYRSGGIRLNYAQLNGSLVGLKDGILLEVGFDDVTPNIPKDISSWAYERAVAAKVPIIDNRAKQVACYHPGYTLVEKLQTISTKYRKEQESGDRPKNFMRHYYDVYCLLEQPEVQAFIGTEEYKAHKTKRFRSGDNPVIAENEAFLLKNAATRKAYSIAYESTRTLYYKGQPEFDMILKKIGESARKL